MTTQQLENKKIEAVRQVLKRYLLPDCLKPEWDGMSLYGIAEQVVETAKNTEIEIMLDDMAKSHLEE